MMVSLTEYGSLIIARSLSFVLNITNLVLFNNHLIYLHKNKVGKEANCYSNHPGYVWLPCISRPNLPSASSPLIKILDLIHHFYIILSITFLGTGGFLVIRYKLFKMGVC
jgi:hypothetical protein